MSLVHVVYNISTDNDFAAKWDVDPETALADQGLQLSREEIIEEARSVIQEVGAAGPRDKGKVMQVIVARLKGKAEGSEINAVVTELLQG